MDHSVRFRCVQRLDPQTVVRVLLQLTRQHGRDGLGFDICILRTCSRTAQKHYHVQPQVLKWMGTIRSVLILHSPDLTELKTLATYNSEA